MSFKQMAVTLSLIAAAVAPASAQPAGRDATAGAPAAGAPAAGPDARYCLRVGPVTGTLVERVRCWTRDQWSDQGVDVDRQWAKEGVTVVE